MNTSERFLTLLSSLDDDYYYFLATNLLGHIPSPFNKPALNRTLLSFFLNPSNLKAQISSITDQEKKLLALTYLLEEASEAQMSAFLPELPFYVLSLKLENLCDRLILFKTSTTYVINPLLGSFVEAYINSSRSQIKQKTDVPFADSNVARAVFNLLINGSVPQREANLHHFIKSGKLRSIFPKFEEEQSLIIFELYRTLALQTKTLERTGSHPTLHLNRCKRILSKNSFDLNMAALEIKHGEVASLAVAKALHVLRFFPLKEKNLITLIGALLNQGSSQNSSQSETAALIFEHLKALGMVYTEATTEGTTVFFNEEITKPAIERSSLTISSDFTVSYYGTPQASDILFLFANIQTCDNLIVYVVTKDSYSRGLDFGLSKERIELYLNSPIAKLAFEQWDEAVSRIKLFDGMVLQCTQEVSVIVKGLPEISDHIILQLAKDLFLMRRSTLDIWGKALAKALDLENLPAPIAEHQDLPEDDILFANNYDFVLKLAETNTEANEAEQTDWETVKQTLLEDAKKKNCLSEELRDLIDSKLIFSTSQIGKDFKYSKLPSASGFDYNAKVSLIKKACGSKHCILRLELTEENLVVLPLEVVKNSGSKAILRAKVIPSGEERNIPIGSIFKVAVARSL